MTSLKNCEAVEPRLTDFLTGALPPADDAAVRTHLEHCERCRASAQDLAVTLDLLRDALAASSAPGAVPARLDPAHRQRVLTDRRPVFICWFNDHAADIAKIAAALVLTLGVFGALVLPSFVRSRSMIISRLGGAVEELGGDIQGRGMPRGWERQVSPSTAARAIRLRLSSAGAFQHGSAAAGQTPAGLQPRAELPAEAGTPTSLPPESRLQAEVRRGLQAAPPPAAGERHFSTVVADPAAPMGDEVSAVKSERRAPTGGAGEGEKTDAGYGVYGVASGAALAPADRKGGAASDDYSDRSVLTKAGAGTLTISGANTYAGGTTVTAGNLDSLRLNAMVPAPAEPAPAAAPVSGPGWAGGAIVAATPPPATPPPPVTVASAPSKPPAPTLPPPSPAPARPAVGGDDKKVALKYDVPRPLFQGTPVPVGRVRNLEKRPYEQWGLQEAGGVGGGGAGGKEIARQVDKLAADKPAADGGATWDDSEAKPVAKRELRESSDADEVAGNQIVMKGIFAGRSAGGRAREASEAETPRSETTPAPDLNGRTVDLGGFVAAPAKAKIADARHRRDALATDGKDRSTVFAEGLEGADQFKTADAPAVGQKHGQLEEAAHEDFAKQLKNAPVQDLSGKGDLYFRFSDSTRGGRPAQAPAQPAAPATASSSGLVVLNGGTANPLPELPMLGDVPVLGRLTVTEARKKVQEESKERIAMGDEDAQAARADGDKRGELMKKLESTVIPETEANQPPTYAPAEFNPYVETDVSAFSTFAIDVDTASYAMARRHLNDGQRPPPESVRTEEFINSFDYDYTPPATGAFAAYVEGAPSPFRGSLQVLKVGIRGRCIGRDGHRAAVLTLVVDTSGSMNTPDRLGRIRETLALLVNALDPADRVALVQFDSSARLVLAHTPAAEKQKILAAIAAMNTSGSTHLEAGLKLGYEVAARGFVAGGSNRLLLLSDGVANLGDAEAAGILKTVAQYRAQGIYCSVFGFGSGNYNDVMLETLADKGDGAYAFIDSADEARRLLVDELASTLHTIAKDVKIQVEFNPDRVKRWRQIGYENRKLTKEQFRDDTVDAGEVGSGQSVTALYEVELQGPAAAALGTVRVRYRDLETGRIEEMARRIAAADLYRDFTSAPPRFRLAAGVAEFAELLRLSPYTAGTDLADLEAMLNPVASELHLDPRVKELARLVQSARRLPAP